MANRSYIEVIVLCVLTILVKNGLAGEGEFRLDYTYSPEANGWIKFHGVPATWFEARLKCYYEGAVLMSPINYQLYSAMKSLMLSRNNASFTGVNSLTHTGDYKSIEGINFLDMPIQWAKGEPDNLDDNERCLAILPDGSIADVKCEEVRTYMCYKERFGNETITECGTSDKEYEFDHRTGSCYKFHPECVTWWRAYMACSSEGGHLVIVNNETEANVLYERYSKSKIYCRDERFIHIGFLMQIRPYWFTVDGQSLHEAGYDHWAPNEPNEPNNVANREMCGALDMNNNEYEFDHRTGSCYKFHPECVTWWRAYMACSSEGGHLVIVNNETEANVLYERYSKSKIYCRDERFIHIGFLMQIRPYWFTVDGQSLHEAGYDHWAPNEPNEPNNVANREMCGALDMNNNGLNDWPCDDILPFVCELSNVKEKKQLEKAINIQEIFQL